jgi:hypothetical protein
MGDSGWGEAHRVVDGRVDGIILTESETAWVRACFFNISAELQLEGREELCEISSNISKSYPRTVPLKSDPTNLGRGWR